MAKEDYCSRQGIIRGAADLVTANLRIRRGALLTHTRVTEKWIDMKRACLQRIGYLHSHSHRSRAMATPMDDALKCRP